LHFAHGSHEADSLSRQRLDQALAVTAVADGAAGHVDAGEQRRVRDDASIPDVRNQVILADDALPVLDQIHQQVEDLGLDRHRDIAAAQFVRPHVERIIFEQIAQDRPLRDEAVR